MIPDLIIADGTPLILSYTALNDYKVCPKRFYHKYIARDVKDGRKTSQQSGGTKQHEALRRRLKLREPLQGEFQVYEPICKAFDERTDAIKHFELKLGLTGTGGACGYNDPSCRLRGALDMVLMTGQAAFIPDFKSGKRWEDPYELEIQGLLLRAHYPALTTMAGTYIWLRELDMGQLYELDAVKAWQGVVNTANVMKMRLARQDWPADDNPLCAWCPVPKGLTSNLDPVCVYRRERPAS